MRAVAALAVTASAAASFAAIDRRHEPLLAWLRSRGTQVGPITLAKSVVGAGCGAFASRAVMLLGVNVCPFFFAALLLV